MVSRDLTEEALSKAFKEERERVLQIVGGRMFQEEEATRAKALCLPGLLEEASMTSNLGFCF